MASGKWHLHLWACTTLHVFSFRTRQISGPSQQESESAVIDWRPCGVWAPLWKLWDWWGPRVHVQKNSWVNRKEQYYCHSSGTPVCFEPLSLYDVGKCRRRSYRSHSRNFHGIFHCRGLSLLISSSFSSFFLCISSFHPSLPSVWFPRIRVRKSLEKANIFFFCFLKMKNPKSNQTGR